MSQEAVLGRDIPSRDNEPTDSEYGSDTDSENDSESDDYSGNESDSRK